jgi:hypothetical protein
MEPRSWRDGPGQLVVRRASLMASDSNERCQPVHLLAALAEVQGGFPTPPQETEIDLSTVMP